MTAKPRRVALYLRVSTDGQSTALQRRDLVEACKYRGWEVTEVYEDAGISGAKGREGRPHLTGFARTPPAAALTLSPRGRWIA
jgi:DNA invertase Pin-like site-specific DNA recombinase